jgi:hypothetical protein
MMHQLHPCYGTTAWSASASVLIVATLVFAEMVLGRREDYLASIFRVPVVSHVGEKSVLPKINAMNEEAKFM